MSYQQQISQAELIESVQTFLLEEILPNCNSQKTEFNTRIAINVLKTASRSVKQGLEHEKKAVEILERITKQPKSGKSADELSADLEQLIEVRAINPGDSQLLKGLMDITMAKVAIDNPNYSTYKALIQCT